ncbi:hypothetical protein PFISCL1PPCAC_27533, partial [Pristionchus fissidentatus]
MSETPSVAGSQDVLIGKEKSWKNREMGPLESSIVYGILIALAFGGLDYLFFMNGSSIATSEWKLNDDVKFRCEGEPNCYPHPSNDSLCGRPFTCHQPIGEWDRMNCIVNSTETKTKDDFVFVMHGNSQQEERIHSIASQVWNLYGKKLIVLFDDNEATDLCKMKYDNLEIRCAPFKSGSKKFLCGTVHCSSENGYICDLEKIASEYESMFYMKANFTFNARQHGNIIEYLRALKKPMVTVGGKTIQTPLDLNFAPYFPGTIPQKTRLFEGLYIERKAWDQLKWAKQYLFESVYGPVQNMQHDTLLHLIEK